MPKFHKEIRFQLNGTLVTHKLSVLTVSNGSLGHQMPSQWISSLGFSDGWAVCHITAAQKGTWHNQEGAGMVRGRTYLSKFAFRKWGKSYQISVMISGSPLKIQTKYLLTLSRIY